MNHQTYNPSRNPTINIVVTSRNVSLNFTSVERSDSNNSFKLVISASSRTMSSLWRCLRRRLKHHFTSTTRPDPRGDLKILPLEIIHIIIDNLRVASVVALLLTCRPYYECFRGRLPPLYSLTREEKKDVLEQLEAVYPNHCYCQACNKLHTFKHRRIKHKKVWVGFEFPELSCSRDDWIEMPFALTHGLVMNSARLIMNRHLYGDGHGYSLEWLEFEKNRARPDDIQLSFRRRGQVLDNELYLLSECTVWHSSGDIQPLRSYFSSPDDCDRIFLCRHVQINPGMPSHTSGIRESIADMFDQQFPGFGMSQIARSCPQCLTDYSVTVIKRDKKDKWRVHIEIYQSLGCCRSVDDWKWKSMAGRSVFLRRRLRRENTYPAGILRQRWLRKEWGDVWAQSEFVEDGNLLSYTI